VKRDGFFRNKGARMGKNCYKFRKQAEEFRDAVGARGPRRTDRPMGLGSWSPGSARSPRGHVPRRTKAFQGVPRRSTMSRHVPILAICKNEPTDSRSPNGQRTYDSQFSCPGAGAGRAQAHRPPWASRSASQFGNILQSWRRPLGWATGWVCGLGYGCVAFLLASASHRLCRPLYPLGRVCAPFYQTPKVNGGVLFVAWSLYGQAFVCREPELSG
jgi:hypothetical protein